MCKKKNKEKGIVTTVVACSPFCLNSNANTGITIKRWCRLTKGSFQDVKNHK